MTLSHRHSHHCSHARADTTLFGDDCVASLCAGVATSCAVCDGHIRLSTTDAVLRTDVQGCGFKLSCFAKPCYPAVSSSKQQEGKRRTGGGAEDVGERDLATESE
eukprot:GHVS01010221.1.p2 GENE.GHVS01010221.1~~GHVS01010221.1.p2  ORF type:complete len:105 (+),score=22.46 GHVS01010221.1:274-588(+)